jgi:hypothetical protein
METHLKAAVRDLEYKRYFFDVFGPFSPSSHPLASACWVESYIAASPSPFFSLSLIYDLIFLFLRVIYRNDDIPDASLQSPLSAASLLLC